MNAAIEKPWGRDTDSAARGVGAARLVTEEHCRIEEGRVLPPMLKSNRGLGAEILR